MSFELRTSKSENFLVDSLYLHFPFCRHLCNYCDFFKRIPQTNNEVRSFEDKLQLMFDQQQALMDKVGVQWSPLKTIYIGGGTPSLWGIEGAKFLQSFFKRNGLAYSDDIEFTLEVNPGSYTPEGIKAFCDLGVNRFSIGLQTLNADLLPYLDRVHALEDSFKTLEYFYSQKFNYSVDFMLGLPHSQDKRDIVQEIKAALEYRPSHMSLYILTVKENYVWNKSLPHEDWIANEYEVMSNVLKANNFLHYEVSNFALSSKESKHNLKYWRNASVAALGPSATGFFNLNNKAMRYKWQTQKQSYDLEELGPKELQLENLYLSLRTSEGLNYIQFWNNEKKIQLFETLLENWLKRGLATSKGRGHISLTSKGMLVLDGLLNEVFSTIKDM